MAMMAMTTSSSMRVKPFRGRRTRAGFAGRTFGFMASMLRSAFPDQGDSGLGIPFQDDGSSWGAGSCFVKGFS
jgi:hypothetical protein